MPGYLFIYLFYESSRRLDSGPDACRASPLPPKPSSSGPLAWFSDATFILIPPIFAGNGFGSSRASQEHPWELGCGRARSHGTAVFKPSGKESPFPCVCLIGVSSDYVKKAHEFGVLLSLPAPGGGRAVQRTQ